MLVENYAELYPQLPAELILFFSDQTGSESYSNSVVKFCSYYHKKYKTKDFPQPRIVSAICEKLVDWGKLSVYSRGGPDGADNKYICFRKSIIDWENYETIALLNLKLSFLVYGFPFIYRYYRPFVLPLLYTNSEGNESLGTCFRYRDGIVSAKHCFEGAKKIAIRGIEGGCLATAKFFVHSKELMDLIYVEIPNMEFLFPCSGPAEILDEVITLGFPKIAGYHNFLSAEKATISARFATTKGQVVADAEDIWIREHLFLITARIQGGNSGGPVVNRKGRIIGVSVNMSKGEGSYDELGYGTVIPISFVDQDLVNKGACNLLDASNIEFVNFDYE